MTEPATAGGLVALEARADGRFRAIDARFADVDGQFAQLDGRVGEASQGLSGLARRFESRFRSIDGRLDATRAQTDHVRQQISEQLETVHHDLLRTALWSLAAVTVINSVVCIATILLLA